MGTSKAIKEKQSGEERMTELTEDDIESVGIIQSETFNPKKPFKIFVSYYGHVTSNNSKRAKELRQQILQALQLEKRVKERIVQLKDQVESCHPQSKEAIGRGLYELQQLLGDKTENKHWENHTLK